MSCGSSISDPPSISIGCSSDGTFLTQVDIKDTSDDNLNSECIGKKCSLYGVHFSQCICLTHPVENLLIEDLMLDCHFLEGIDYKDMKNNNKRFALYYHYAINIYMATGKLHIYLRK